MSKTVYIILTAVALMTLAGCGKQSVKDEREVMPERIEGPVVVVLIFDHTTWWTRPDGRGGQLSSAAKRWIGDRLLPWLQGSDIVLTMAIGPRERADGDILSTYDLPGTGRYDPLFLSALQGLKDDIQKMAQRYPNERGSDIWGTLDHAADLLNNSVLGDRKRIVILFTDFCADSPGPRQCVAHKPVACFPGGTHALALFVPRRGMSSTAWAKFRQDVRAKLRAMNVDAEPLEAAQSELLNLKTALPRPAALW